MQSFCSQDVRSASSFSLQWFQIDLENLLGAGVRRNAVELEHCFENQNRHPVRNQLGLCATGRFDRGFDPSHGKCFLLFANLALGRFDMGFDHSHGKCFLLFANFALQSAVYFLHL